MAKGNKASEANGEGVSTVSETGVVDLSKMNFSAPEGYREQTDDVVGFWDGDKGYPIHFIPEEATLHDSDIEPQKVSVLVKGVLVEACEVYLGDEVSIADEGDRVGVWMKPGMKKLRDLGGQKVWVRQTGEKDVGKPSPMKVFGVYAAERGTTIPVVGDYRDKSKNTRHLLEGAPLSHSNLPRPTNGMKDDSPGF